jgi:aconitate hydratase
VGYGCTTCIGNSGLKPVAAAVQKENLVVAAVLSGNRNFEGCINSLVKANAGFAAAGGGVRGWVGRVDIDLEEPALDKSGVPVYLRTSGPLPRRLRNDGRAVRPEMFRHEYWRSSRATPPKSLPTPTGTGTFAWDEHSTYIKKPPYFEKMADPNPPVEDLHGMRVLAVLGDSVTTDHISPAGSIPPDSPAGRYLIAQGVKPGDFNSYGARRGNHEVMVRGTLANIRLRNQLAPGTEGGLTVHTARWRDVDLRCVGPLPEDVAAYDHRREGVWLRVAPTGRRGRAVAA